MSIASRSASRFRADLVAYDSGGSSVLLVEIKTSPSNLSVVAMVMGYLSLATPPIPFGMIVDPERILLVDRENPGIVRPLESSTAEILEHYDPDYSRKRIFHTYMEILVESWLRDLAIHWKSTSPPTPESITSSGLLDRLRGGTTRMEVSLCGDLVY